MLGGDHPSGEDRMLKLLRVLALGLLGPTSDRLTIVTAAAAFFFLTMSLGLALAWQSWRSMQSQESGSFRVKRLWLWGLVYVLALVIG
jgi:hypothetical protein